MYHSALVQDGYIETQDINLASFIVHDAVHPGLDEYLKHKPNFVTPHTPQSSFLWDGILRTDIPVCCNFVSGPAGRRIMELYGYPYRVEVVGFNRCEVRKFTPTTGNDLLIVPSHSLQHREYTYQGYIDWALETLRFILKNRDAFGKITLCWDEERFDYKFMDEMKKKGFIIIPTNPYVDKEPLKRMMYRMEMADLVLSCGTVGCVAVALGRPTVFFSERGQARSFPKDANNPHLYDHFLRFPLAAEKMTIDEILAIRTAPNPQIEHWKEQIIGGPFNAQKFIEVIGQYTA
jgi:hypothetical protein